MKTSRHLKGIAAALFAVLTTLFTTPSSHATLADSIAAGRAALKAKNIVAANAAFQQAVGLSPSDPEANVLAALTSLAVLETRPEAQALLTKLGVATAGRNLFHWTADSPKHFKPKVLTDDFEAYAKAQVLPALAAADLELSKASSSTFQITLSSDETGLSGVTLDLGDVLFIRSLVYTLTSGVHLCGTYNTSFKLSDISSWLPTNAMTLQKLFATYPNLLTVSNGSELSSAVTAFGQAVDIYVSASDFMRARIDSTDRLFVIDADYAGVEAKARNEVVAVKASLSGSVQLDTRTHVFAGAATTTAQNLRGLLPQYTFNHPQSGTFPDVHFAGVLPDMTVDRVEEYFQRVGNRLDHLFHHRDDPIDPSLVITSPKPNARVPFQNAEVVTISGTAHDNIAVTRITVVSQYGSHANEITIATLTPVSKGTVQWTAAVPVDPGFNSVKVTAFDHQGNLSKVKNLAFTFVELADATLSVQGSGKVSPGLPQGNKVELAKVYKFSAAPAAGFIFDHWDINQGGGSFTSTDRVAEFVFTQAPTITANFIPNPFIPVAGNLAAVVQSTIYDQTLGDFRTLNRGLLTLKLTASGTFTAKLLYDGATFSLKGQFSSANFYATQFEVKRPKKSSLFVSVSLDLTSSEPSLQVSMNDSVNFGDYASGYINLGKPQNLAAHYTVNVDSPSDDGYTDPANITGHGYFSISIDKKGGVRGLGVLADGSKLSFSSFAQIQIYFDGTQDVISPMIPFFAALDTHGSTFAGTLPIDTTVPFGSTSVYGNAHWTRSATAGTPLVVDPFDLDLQLQGGEFDSPPKKQILVPFGNSSENGDLSIALSPNPLQSGFTLSTANIATFDSPNTQKIKLKIDVSTGLFSGSCIDPSGQVPRSFGGVIRQDDLSNQIGVGFVIGAGESDPVLIQAN